MVLTRHKPVPAEAALLPACAASRPAPVAPSVPLPPRRVHADEVLAELRAADTTPAALGMRRPAAPAPRPLPGFATIAYLTAVSTAIQADYERHLDTLRVLDDISAAFTEHPELLTTDGHPGPRLLLRRIAAESEQAIANRKAPTCDACAACGREFVADAKRWPVGKNTPLFVHVICPSDGPAFAPVADAVKAGASL